MGTGQGQYDYVAPLTYPSGDGDTGEIFGFIAGEQYRALMLTILSRLAASGILSGDAVAAIRAEIAACRIEAEHSWHFCRGFFEPLLLSNGEGTTPLRGIDQFFVQLSVLSKSVEHNFFSDGSSLYFDQEFKTVAGSLLGIRQGANGPIITLRDGEEIALNTPSSAHTPALVRQLPSIEVAGRRVAFLFSEDVEPECVANVDQPVAPMSEGVLRAWSDALVLIREISIPYFGWCVNAVKHIVPIEAPGGAMISGSQGQFPGQVYMSAALEPIKLAEMLIHEASHQYYRAIQFTGPISDLDAGETFYSPVVGRERPVEKLLLAYHAFANVYAFMGQCAAKGRTEHGFVASNTKRVSAELRTLAEGLDGATSLTSLGREMWKELKRGVAIQ